MTEAITITQRPAGPARDPAATLEPQQAALFAAILAALGTPAATATMPLPAGRREEVAVSGPLLPVDMRGLSGPASGTAPPAGVRDMLRAFGPPAGGSAALAARTRAMPATGPAGLPLVAAEDHAPLLPLRSEGQRAVQLPPYQNAPVATDTAPPALAMRPDEPVLPLGAQAELQRIPVMPGQEAGPAVGDPTVLTPSRMSSSAPVEGAVEATQPSRQAKRPISATTVFPTAAGSEIGPARRNDFGPKPDPKAAADGEIGPGPRDLEVAHGGGGETTGPVADGDRIAAGELPYRTARLELADALTQTPAALRPAAPPFVRPSELPAIAIRALANGQQRIVVSLEPAALGQVRLVMEFAPDGKVNLRLRVQKEEALVRLQRETGSFAKIFAANGFKLGAEELRIDAAGDHGFDEPPHHHPTAGREQPRTAGGTFAGLLEHLLDLRT